jgi:hypothetical protein
MFIPSVSSRWCIKKTVVDYWARRKDIRQEKVKLCMRAVGLNGEFLREYPWEEEAEFASVWCD